MEFTYIGGYFGKSRLSEHRPRFKNINSKQSNNWGELKTFEKLRAAGKQDNRQRRGTNGVALVDIQGG